MSSSSLLLKKVPATSLATSEPPPEWFGNGRNEPANPAWSNPNWLKVVKKNTKKTTTKKTQKNPHTTPHHRSTVANTQQLQSRFHFNFAESHSGRNNFGVLRVLNDDLVQPDRGFGTHPHNDMEIVT
jgi:hypothetical protein